MKTYVQFKRLELFFSKQFEFSHSHSVCDCHIFHLGFLGFSWLSHACSNYEETDETL
jgi:hypothetical protein